jgi:uncharacterized membrane protein YkvA (DUF1232 family)
MDTRFIEAMIENLDSGHEPDPELCDLLAAVADRQGGEAGEDDLHRAAAFVRGYIDQVPYMIKVASTSAANLGLQDEMRHILETVASYWKEGDDIIPDELGVIGLLDDAYCSLTLLQAVSDNYRMMTGKHLFPNDLTLANQAMHRIIGEPYVSELDTLVVRTMKKARLLDAVKKLAGEDKRLLLDANSTVWNHGPAGQLDVHGLEKLGLL